MHVGKTGTLTPFAFLKPVLIAGSTISAASLHNVDEIERLGIQIGDWVVVEKAGKVIPHVVRVELHRRDGTQRPFQFPQALSRVPDARRSRRGRRLHPLPEPELPRPTTGEPPLFRFPQRDGH